MTALTAVRASSQEPKDCDNLERRAVPRQQHRRRNRIIEEPHPELLLTKKEKEKQEARLRYKKPSLPATIEDASEDDEELATTSDCSLSSSSLEGPSPHVLPPEERFWYCLPANQAFSSHPLISPKFGRRSPVPFLFRTSTAPATGLQQQRFSDPVVRRKRSLSLLGERLSGASFDSLPADFLNLPPIPETVPVRKASERKISSSTEEDAEKEAAEDDVCEAYSSE